MKSSEPIPIGSGFLRLRSGVNERAATVGVVSLLAANAVGDRGREPDQGRDRRSDTSQTPAAA
jgi:hypothetical protein